MENVKIANILEKDMTGKDKEYRYVMTSDLFSELEKEAFKADQDLEPKLTSTVLQRLEDTSEDVSGIAVKCLAPLVKKISVEGVVQMANRLYDKLLNGKYQHRDIASVAMKTFFAEVTTTSLAKNILDSIAPKLVDGIGLIKKNKKKSNSGVNVVGNAKIKCECLDIGGDLLHRFGNLSKDDQYILTQLLTLLGSDQEGVRKKSISYIASLAPSLSDSLLEKATNRVVNLLNTKRRHYEMTCTNVQMIGSLSRAVGYRFGPHLAQTVPLLISCCTSTLQNDKLSEYSLQALESLVLMCPKDISKYCEGILNISLKYVKVFTDCIELGEIVDEPIDDDSASWKVHQAAVKCLSAIMKKMPTTCVTFILKDVNHEEILEEIRECNMYENYAVQESRGTTPGP